MTVPEKTNKSPGDLLIGTTLLFIGKEDVKVQYTTTGEVFFLAFGTYHFGR